MLGVLTAQEVGVVHSVLLGGVAAVGKNVGTLGESGFGHSVAQGPRSTKRWRTWST